MNAGNGDAQAPLKGASLALTAFALALGTFIIVLDSTIANVSLPTIAGDLSVSADQGTWVITSFAVANGVSVPLTGWLMGRYGAVRTFVTAVLLFTAASFLCGIAWNMPALIGFRALQGGVSGCLIPGSQALLIAIFPSNKRGVALSIWSITTLVAPIMGPLLGGHISDNYHWSWIFFINIPVGLFCAFVCWRNLHTRETPIRKLPIDTIGLGLLVIWVGSLQIMLDTGKDADWFASTHIIVLAAIALVVFIAWIIWEMTEEHPIVDLSLFKNWNFTAGTIALSLGYAIFFANAILLPLWLQTQMGYTATWAGLVLIPTGIMAVILTPPASRFLARFDARWGATISFVALALSYFMRAEYTPDADFWALSKPLYMQGVGLSFMFMSLVAISMQGVEPHRIPAASGISNFVRISVAAFAAATITTFWDHRESFHQTRLAEAAHAARPAMQQAMASLQSQGMSQQQAYQVLDHTLVNQAYLLATNDIFWLSGWLSVIAIIFIWVARKPQGATPSAGGE